MNKTEKENPVIRLWDKKRECNSLIVVIERFAQDVTETMGDIKYKAENIQKRIKEADEAFDEGRTDDAKIIMAFVLSELGEIRRMADWYDGGGDS